MPVTAGNLVSLSVALSPPSPPHFSALLSHVLFFLLILVCLLSLFLHSSAVTLSALLLSLFYENLLDFQKSVRGISDIVNPFSMLSPEIIFLLSLSSLEASLSLSSSSRYLSLKTYDLCLSRSSGSPYLYFLKCLSRPQSLNLSLLSLSLLFLSKALWLSFFLFLNLCSLSIYIFIYL